MPSAPLPFIPMKYGEAVQFGCKKINKHQKAKLSSYGLQAYVRLPDSVLGWTCEVLASTNRAYIKHMGYAHRNFPASINKQFCIFRDTTLKYLCYWSSVVGPALHEGMLTRTRHACSLLFRMPCGLGKCIGVAAWHTPSATPLLCFRPVHWHVPSRGCIAFFSIWHAHSSKEWASQVSWEVLPQRARCEVDVSCASNLLPFCRAPHCTKTIQGNFKGKK